MIDQGEDQVIVDDVVVQGRQGEFQQEFGLVDFFGECQVVYFC